MAYDVFDTSDYSGGDDSLGDLRWFYEDPEILASIQDSQANSTDPDQYLDMFSYVRDVVTSITDAGGGFDSPGPPTDRYYPGGPRASDDPLLGGGKEEPGGIRKILTNYWKMVQGETAEDRKTVAPIIAGTLGAMLMGVSGGISAAQARKMKKEELEQLKPLQMAQTAYYDAKSEDERRRAANQDFSKVGFTGIINQPFRPAPITPLYQPRRP